MFCKIEVKLYPFYLPLFLPSIPGINRFVRILIMFCAKKSLFFFLLSCYDITRDS